MSLADRVREVLAPSFRVERELGCGAMAVVFLAEDLALECPRAIKVLRPEVATAVAVERFLREGRLLARLRHPNIIQVHQAGNVGGLLYYVMDYAAGETLADRLERGPLTPQETVAIGLDLLAALAAAHKLGIVHRDVKPGNVFLVEGQAYLADFGIARTLSPSETDPGLTVDPGRIGTPAYMTPEQLTGQPATAASDLYATGLLCYEALTGRLWIPMQAPEDADWTGIPPRIAHVLRRALALDRTKRWHTAEAMRRALGGAPARSRWRSAVVGSALGMAAVGLFLVLKPSSAGTFQRQVIAIEDFGGNSRAERAVADSLAEEIAFGLRGAPDFKVRLRAGSGDTWLTLKGTLRQVGESLRVVPTLELKERSIRLPEIKTPVARRYLLVDSLTTALLVQVLTLENKWIPTGVVPRTRNGLMALIAAERAYFRAQRDLAAQLYIGAFEQDATCVLCLYRYNDLRRFLEEDPDPLHVATVRRYTDSFPPQYQALIKADRLANPERIGALRQVTEDHREFPDGWYRYGEEVYNRGPLWGRDRYEALGIFRAPGVSPDLRPPAGFDETTLLIAKGDERGARDAIAYLARFKGTARDEARLALPRVAFEMRFVGVTDGVVLARRALQHQEVADLVEAAAGPRVLHTFDLPNGAVALGKVYETFDDRPLWVTSGRIAQVTGHAALGQLQAMEPVGSRLEQSGEASSVRRYPILLHALLVTFDDLNEARVGRGRVADALIRLESEPDNDRWTAAWLLAVLAYRLGDTTAAKHHRQMLQREPVPQPRRTLVDAWAAAARGGHAEALERTDSLVHDLNLIEGEAYGDRFLRAGIKLSRAEWLTRAGLRDRARNELRWHQHFNLTAYPLSEPVSAETDWALSTFARWRLSGWLGDKKDAEICRARDAVARHWKDGDPPYRERARLAGESLRTLCSGSESPVAVHRPR